MGFWQGRKATPVQQSEPHSSARSPARESAVGVMPLPDASSLLRAHETSGQGWFWQTDAAGGISYITPHVAAEIAVEPQRVIGMPLQKVFGPGEHVSGPGRTLAFLLTKQAKFDNFVVKSTGRDVGTLWALAGSPQFAVKPSRDSRL
jgi:hypothetical protein